MGQGTLAFLVAITLLSGCSSDRGVSREDQAWRGMVEGWPAEAAVHDAVLATDPKVAGQQLYQTRYLTAPDGKGGGYIAMIAAFGGEKSYGPPHTWLYHVQGNRLTRLFGFPFEATELQGGSAPRLQGDYWAYECLVCDSPDSGYMAKIPVKVFKKGTAWRIASNLPARDRARWSREAHLVVQSGLQKYGPDPEGRRMLAQLDGLFRKGRGTQPSAAPPRRLSRQTSTPSSQRAVD